jgi:hypothetical protein
VLDHQDPESRLSPELVRRLVAYSQRTYFKHLRLYDFVFKNANLSEKKLIRVPLYVPQCGQRLSSAQVVEDNKSQIWFEIDEAEINPISIQEDTKSCELEDIAISQQDL